MPSWAATAVMSARACWSVRRPQEAVPASLWPLKPLICVSHRQNINYSQNPSCKGLWELPLAPSIEGRAVSSLPWA